ncbi:MAG: cyclic nucleotide-binding domain-containing protein [Actinobacteria bacterium]|nr:cyclic nucleotide-binding domain-containing protein [Actinomycetota bacterium]
MRIKQRVGHSLIKALRRVPAFSTLVDHDLLLIVGASVNLYWNSGSIVFERGDSAEALYIVLSGKVRIYFDNGENETDVATVGPGEFFGELSLLRDEVHSKSAQASEDCELMIIPRESFRSLISSDSTLAEHISEKMEERLKADDALQRLT